jgi:hypothetical protein
MNAAKRPVTTSTPYSKAQPFSASVPPSQAFGSPGSPGSPRISSEARTAQPNASRPKRISYSGARQAIAFESSVKLTVNLLLAVVAATTIVKLVPYYQSQQGQLTTLQASVKVAERNNAELRSQFNRNFDPAQAARIMQEQSGMSYPNQKKVIWQAPPERILESIPAGLPEASPESLPETPSNGPSANE